jgi:hypothetical protein
MPGRAVLRELGRRLPGAALLLFVAGRCLVPMDETDLFYNLRLGEIVLQTGHVPRTNLLSFTYPDIVDPNLAWVFQVVLALCHRAAGVPGTVLLKTAFALATFGLLYRVARRRGAHPGVAAAVLALAAWTAEPRLVERPHLVTLLGLAVLLLALERAESRRPRLLLGLVPLGLVWANANSCFFLAPAVLLLYAAGAALDERWRPAASAPHPDAGAGAGALPAPKLPARTAALVAAALLPLAFATPSGAGVVGYVTNHFRMPYVRPLQEYRTAEWPLDGPFFLLAAAVAIVAVAEPVAGAWAARDGWPWRRGRRRPRAGQRRLLLPPLRQLFPIVALAALGSRRIRFVAETALFCGPFVAARATTLAAALAARIGQGRRPPQPSSPPSSPQILGARGRAALLAPAVTVALGVLALGPRLEAAAAGRPIIDLEIEDGLIPRAAIRWIDRQGLRDRLYNDLEVGSYLAWDGWPANRVFQDPRINGYPAEMHALLRRPDLTRTDWQGLLDRFGVRTALVSFPDVNPRAALFDPARWALAFRASDALVFVRRGPDRTALIAAAEIPVAFRYHSSSGIEPIPLAEPPAGATTRPCEWQRRLGDFHMAGHDPERAWAAYQRALGEPEGEGCLDTAVRDGTRRAAGALALRFGDPARAAALLDGLTQPAARTNRAFALIQIQRPGEALAELDRALTSGGGGNHAQADATFARALALAHLGRNEESLGALRAFLQRFPEHFAARRAGALRARLARQDRDRDQTSGPVEDGLP